MVHSRTDLKTTGNGDSSAHCYSQASTSYQMEQRKAQSKAGIMSPFVPTATRKDRKSLDGSASSCCSHQGQGSAVEGRLTSPHTPFILFQLPRTLLQISNLLRNESYNTHNTYTPSYKITKSSSTCALTSSRAVVAMRGTPSHSQK